MQIPLNLKYTKDHEWISIDEKIANVFEKNSFINRDKLSHKS